MISNDKYIRMLKHRYWVCWGSSRLLWTDVIKRNTERLATPYKDMINNNISDRDNYLEQITTLGFFKN